jgi:hypothetical protein
VKVTALLVLCHVLYGFFYEGFSQYVHTHFLMKLIENIIVINKEKALEKKFGRENNLDNLNCAIILIK